MRRRTFIVGLTSSFIATMNTTISRAQVWSLVTQEEFDREQDASQKPPAVDATPVSQPPDPGAPKIDIKQPDPGKPIKTPVTVIVGFIAEPGSKIVLSTLRVVYGTFIKLDITDKIRANAKLDDSGLRAEGVGLPSGNHNVTISIADDRGRVGNRAIQFVVA
jgi:hypothetical protein